MLLGLLNGEITKVKDRRRQNRTCATFGHTFDQMIQRTDASTGNDGNVHRITYGARQRQVEPGARTVAVHRREKNFTSAQRHNLLSEFHRINAGGFVASMGEYLPFSRRNGFGVDGNHDTLAAKLIGGLGHHIWARYGRGIERYLVRPGKQQIAHIFAGSHTAANCQRDITLLGGASNDVKHGATIFKRRFDVQKTQLIRARRIIGPRAFDRITCIHQIDKVHAFDHTAIGDIQTGDNAGFQHMVRAFENIDPGMHRYWPKLNANVLNYSIQKGRTDMITFSDEARDIQARFGCNKLADRMAKTVFRKEFTDKDRTFISNAMFFFLATVDANGQPQCSYKGGGKGFVRVTGVSELVFPFYEGNGMYMTAGNITAMGKVGLLFVDFEGQTRLRVNGVATIDDAHPMNAEVEAAQLVVRLAVSDIHPNCSRNVHKMEMVETSSYTPKSDAENVVVAPWGDAFDDVLPKFMKSRD